MVTKAAVNTILHTAIGIEVKYNENNKSCAQIQVPLIESSEYQVLTHIKTVRDS